ncbi:MAG: hypothetical protein EPO42_08185 [Gallionellaceae bacterium]|nr:MAG: hypothetical protein EPO42_08185 [Gallionellaceae bacterium]
MTVQLKPLRIKSLTLTDFRAFPGPAPAHFDLDGKNLLVYGENGSGKSSLFHALREFFSLKPAKPLAHYRNVFSAQPEAVCKVGIEYVGDAVAVEWTMAKHPCEYDFGTPVTGWYDYFFRGSDSRTRSVAMRCACLDYRALLDTNYLHGDGDINLFDIALKRLLADYPITVAGGQQKSLMQLWASVEDASLAKPPAPQTVATPSAEFQGVLAACAEFNSGFRQALDALHPHVGVLLGELIGADVVVAPFSFAGLTYSAGRLKRDREVVGRELKLDVSFRNHSPSRPQDFLNEARLSALALAIYLAGRLACTSTATQDALKLLVLDDVLIGLDHSNRLPVLDVLHTHFADWQVVLLTHDKTWFDLARERLPENDWACCEVYEGDTATAAPMPIVRPTLNKPARALLQKADDLLKLGYVEAAANYARQAFEFGLRIACELKNIKLNYLQDSTDHKVQDLLDALKGWTGSAKVPKTEWDAAIHRLELLKNVVMNPYSHPSSPNIPKQEVTDAIAAVTAFLDLVAKK